MGRHSLYVGFDCSTQSLTGGLAEDDAARNVRALIEAQLMATAIHSGWMGERVAAIHATGGAARNHEILRVMADVHDAPVYPLEVSESAALGAALRAYHADQVAEGQPISWEEAVADLVVPAAPIRPEPQNVAVYAELKKAYAAREVQALALMSPA